MRYCGSQSKTSKLSEEGGNKVISEVNYGCEDEEDSYNMDGDVKLKLM
jgi:hypothetical protein